VLASGLTRERICIIMMSISRFQKIFVPTPRVIGTSKKLEVLEARISKAKFVNERTKTGIYRGMEAV